MSETAAAGTIGELLRGPAEAVASAIEAALDDPAVPPPLAEAMRYVALGAGKRLRPALVLLSARAAAGGRPPRADPLPAAVAVELVHCYSLVHDDLPAMDDDDLRRGRPTCHVRYGDAMAILVGDALLTRAFEVLARDCPEKALAADLAAELAAGAGPAGMIAGQVADMALCDVPDGEDGRRYIYLRKTAALCRAAARMGALCGGADDDALAALSEFGECLGLAYQIADDLLDASHPASVLGKTPGKDARAGKRTYAEVGACAARERAGALTGRACAALDRPGLRAGQLRQLAVLLTRRDR